MKTNYCKRTVSFIMALAMCLSILTMGTNAASKEAEIRGIAFPRGDDAAFDGEWGHDELFYMGGWHTNANRLVSLFTLGDNFGPICYCIEPGNHVQDGSTYTASDESYWENYPDEYNSTIRPTVIQAYIGRILQYGYTGNISYTMFTQNPADAENLAYAFATQLLIWETVVGERDADFNHVSTGSYDAVLDSISKNHPLYSKIMSKYKSIESSVKNHTKLPSFCTSNEGKASSVKLEWNGSVYTATLTDTNNVLSRYSFKSNNPNVTVSVSGSKLTLTSKSEISDIVTLSAVRNAARRSFVVWGDGVTEPGVGQQEVIAYADSVTDPVQGFIKLTTASAPGVLRIVKTSEDGVVENVQFKITGNGIDRTVRTNSSGEILVTGLTPGVYTVTEIMGDRYEPQESKQVTVTSGQTAYVSFSNRLRRGSVRVIKTADDNFVKGVKFHLYGNSLMGQKVDMYAETNASGIAEFKDVFVGSGYTLEEVDTDAKYVLPAAQTVSVEWNKVTEAHFENKLRRSSVRVIKSAEDGFVEGVRFHLYGTSLSGEYVDMYAKTNSHGVAVFENVPVGKNYTLEEVDTDKKYIIPDSQNVTVEWDDVTEAYFENKLKRGDLRVIKSAEDSFVEGVRFHLYGTSLSGQKVDMYAETDASGIAEFKDVLIGSGYTLEEVDTAEKYIVPDSKIVNIEWDKATEAHFENMLKRSSVRVVKSAEDGFVEGVRFHLYGTSLSGEAVDMYAKTNSQGIAVFENVPVGKNYTLEEVDTAERYIVPDSQTVNIQWDKATETRFENKLKRGTVRVTKNAEDGFVEGVRFHLYGTSLSGQKVDMYTETDASGIAEFKDVLIGSGYTLEEVDTAVKYIIPDSQNADVQWNKVTNKSFDNRLKKWNAVVTKSDKETENSQGDATLKGAVYGVYKGTELIDKYTTDEKGRFTTKYYPCGDDWTIREITPSEGYTLDETVYKVGAEPEKYTVEYNTINIAVTETVVKGSISIVKHMDDGSTQIETPEKGAEFEIYLKSAGSFAAAKESERDRLICDENGYAKSKLFPYGAYTVKQTKGSPGTELMGEFDVLINEDSKVYRYIINDSIFKSYVEIVKKDAETGKIIPVSGIGFKVRNTDTGKYVVQHVTYPTPMDIDIFYTDDTGRLMLPEALLYGNYEIIEVQSAYGYVLDKEPVPFMVDGTLATVTVEKTNMPQKGKISITKTGEVFASVIEENNAISENEMYKMYKPVYEKRGLEGAVFEIRAAEDIYTPDGTLRYKKGELVDTVTSDSNGKCTSRELYLGKYEITEIKAPYGSVLNGEMLTVELKYAGQEVAITGTEAGFYNERQKAALSLNKSLETDEVFGIGASGEILSVTFGLYAAEDITAHDGNIIPKDGLIEITATDENGHAVFTADIPVGAKLYVKEISADGKYIVSDEQYPVIFEYAGQETALVKITVNNGETIVNYISYGKIIGHKVERGSESGSTVNGAQQNSSAQSGSQTGAPVAGAVFGLFDIDETEFTAENAYFTAVSDEDGIFVFEKVPLGKWIILELESPEGFLLSDERYEVEITENAQVIEITAINDRIPEISTSASVSGEKEVTLEKAGSDSSVNIVTIDDIVSYRHLIPGQEYVIKGILMDKKTGKAFLVSGKEIISELVFIPETADGTVTLSFTFDASAISLETDIVVFEELYSDEILLAAHANIEDFGQTVKLLPPVPVIPETGDAIQNSGLYIYISLSLLISGIILFKKSKNHLLTK